MNTNNNRQIFRSGLMYIMIFVAIVGLVSWFNQGSNGQTTEVSYTQFVQELKKGDIKEINMQTPYILLLENTKKQKKIQIHPLKD